MLRDAQQLEMEFGRRSKVSHTTTKQLCEIADISHCYSNYKDEEVDAWTKTLEQIAKPQSKVYSI